MMTTGSVLGVMAVVAIAYAPNLAAFTAAWLLAGVVMAATFYQPAFAALTRWWGSDRVLQQRASDQEARCGDLSRSSGTRAAATGLVASRLPIEGPRPFVPWSTKDYR